MHGRFGGYGTLVLTNWTKVRLMVSASPWSTPLRTWEVGSDMLLAVKLVVDGFRA